MLSWANYHWTNVMVEFDILSGRINNFLVKPVFFSSWLQVSLQANELKVGGVPSGKMGWSTLV